ncbi:MAG: hypothetical protein OXF02_07365 [Simkaniaceae bacterium]|nr:hypothetical protein [Simkaniaceae bacterium]
MAIPSDNTIVPVTTRETPEADILVSPPEEEADVVLKTEIVARDALNRGFRCRDLFCWSPLKCATGIAITVVSSSVIMTTTTTGVVYGGFVGAVLGLFAPLVPIAGVLTAYGCWIHPPCECSCRGAEKERGPAHDVESATEQSDLSPLTPAPVRMRGRRELLGGPVPGGLTVPGELVGESSV